MAAEDAALQGVTGTMNVTLNGIVYACKGTYVLIKELSKLFSWAYLKNKEINEKRPGLKTLAAMLSMGKKTQCVTMKASDYIMFHDKAVEYGIQYAAIDQNKAADNDKDYVTVFIDSNNMAQFSQFVKDYNILSVTEHGQVESKPEPIFTVDTIKELFDSPEKLTKYVNTPNTPEETPKFNLAKFMNDEICKGQEPEVFIEEITPSLVELCLARGLTIDLTGNEIVIPGLEKEIERITEQEAAFRLGEQEPVAPADMEPETISKSAIVSSLNPNNEQHPEKVEQPSQELHSDKETTVELDNLNYHPASEEDMFIGEPLEVTDDDPMFEAHDKMVEEHPFQGLKENILDEPDLVTKNVNYEDLTENVMKIGSAPAINEMIEHELGDN